MSDTNMIEATFFPPMTLVSYTPTIPRSEHNDRHGEYHGYSHCVNHGFMQDTVTEVYEV